MISLYNVMGIIRRWKSSIISLRLGFLEIPHKNIWVSWGVLFKGLGVQKGTQTPCWLRPWPKPLKRTPQETQKKLGGISKNLNLKLIIGFFHLLIISMTLFNDIMPYFDEFIHVYCWNMSILWSPLKIWTPQNFTTANFRHPVSKSWLRHWLCYLPTILKLDCNTK